ncbi:MAG: PrsW family intramembrane metalloprotease [Eggerthellaceae bacterium]|nr:PrsW family intramembrane metalloprotease [Eggerthellaceae bacterium]
MSLILLFAALLPAVVLMWYVYHKDTVEKEPVGLVTRVFLLGAAAGPIAAILENILFGVFEAIIPPGALLLILEYFIGVAAVEEAGKYAALSTVRKHPEFNYVFDGVVYGVAAALGFAALENVLYVFDGGLEVAISRAIFSVPGHCADGVVMGCFFGLARQRELAGNKAGARSYYWLAFLLPVIEHGFYDAALSTESDLMVLLALVTQIAFVVFAMVLVNRISKSDTPFSTNPTPATAAPQQQSVYQPPVAPVSAAGTWVCPRCGQQNASKFCGECGTPRP